MDRIFNMNDVKWNGDLSDNSRMNYISLIMIHDLNEKEKNNLLAYVNSENMKVFQEIAGYSTSYSYKVRDRIMKKIKDVYDKYTYREYLKLKGLI